MNDGEKTLQETKKEHENRAWRTSAARTTSTRRARRRRRPGSGRREEVGEKGAGHGKRPHLGQRGKGKKFGPYRLPPRHRGEGVPGLLQKDAEVHEDEPGAGGHLGLAEEGHA